MATLKGEGIGMKVYRSQFSAMGGANEILVSAADERAAANAMRAAANEVLRIEAKYSRYRDDSIISQINQSAGSGEFIACDDETNWLLSCANELFIESGGLFDATSGILRRAWDFTKPVLPTQEALNSLLALVGWDKVERKGDSVRLTEKGMQLDFGGFGKEYAADRAVQVLKDHGVTSGYVNLGGDICAVGPDSDGKPWLIGVSNPRVHGAIIATMPVARGALATSGDYVKYFELGDRIYSHILNPKTGMPVNCWAQTTVRAPTAIMAGALSTIAMLKEAAAIDFLANALTPYLFVGQDAQIFSNQQLAQAA
jgi:FAD:protein FMN transferase